MGCIALVRCVLVLRCVSAGVVWYPDAGWSTASACVESFVRIWEQTATFALYGINWLVFIAVVESVYSAVRTESSYKADYV